MECNFCKQGKVVGDKIKFNSFISCDDCRSLFDFKSDILYTGDTVFRGAKVHRFDAETFGECLECGNHIKFINIICSDAEGAYTELPPRVIEVSRESLQTTERIELICTED